MKKIVISFVLFYLLLNGCKKEPDIVSSKSITGQVFNLANDSGLANVTVFLNISGPEGYSSLTATSNANGNFIFSNVQIHTSNDYKYSLEVPSNGAGGSQPAIDGSSIVLDKSKLNQNFILHVIPHFKYWELYLTNSSFTSSDTFLFTMQQNIIHKNTSNSNWQLVNNCPCPITGTTNVLGGIGNYWMGWWQVTLDKTVNGVHTVNTDSFYLGWGATVTDTIPW